MWYTSNNGSGWRIGYATSSDGINWTSYASNPVITPTQSWEGSDADGSSVLFDGTTYEIFYHGSANLSYATSTDGINWNKPADKNPVLTRGAAGTFDSDQLAGPGALRLPNGTTLLYYGGYSTAGGVSAWRIGLATDGPIVIPPPPVVVIPGMFASWNHDALLHDKTVDITSWKLNPMVKEYDGLLATLRTLGFTDNPTLFLFAYDWRKKLDDSADDLNTYLNAKIPGTSKVNLVGHSLGGLVARIYAQKYGTGRINKLLTVGSPHQGVPQAYKAAAGGELDRDNSLQWLALRLILLLTRAGYTTEKDALVAKAPVVNDLIPTYDFLQSESGTTLSSAVLNVKNPILPTYNSTFSSIFSVFQSIVGNKSGTPFRYVISVRNPTDVAYGLYPDGRPVRTTNASGDATVNQTSATADSDTKTLGLNHGELVFKNDGIKEILNSLSLTFSDSQITEGRATSLFPAVLFLISSPVSMVVEFEGKTYPETDGLVFFENAKSGAYHVKLTGTATGKYTLYIIQITETADYWDSVKGEITKSPPSSQVDTYLINFPSSPLFPTPQATGPTPTPTPTLAAKQKQRGFSFFSTKDKEVLGVATESGEVATESATPTQETYQEPVKPSTNLIKWIVGIILALILLLLRHYFSKK